MGNCCCGDEEASKLNKREIVLACFGIDGAGKTTCLKILKGENPRNVLSTNGFSMIEMSFDQEFKIKVYDLGGNERIRDIWRNYYAEIHGFIYVLDTSRSTRTSENIRVMRKLLAEPEIRGKPCMIVLNRFNSLEFDEYTFTNEVGLQQISHTYHQHFFVTHLDEYDGFLDKAKGPSKPVMSRFRARNPNPLLEGFVLMIRQVIQDYVRLNEKVVEAEALLKQRQEQERIRRRIRLAELEKQGDEPEALETEGEVEDRPPTTMSEMVKRNEIVETVLPGPSGGDERTPQARHFPMGSVKSDDITRDEEPGPSTSLPMQANSLDRSIDADPNAQELSHMSSEVFQDEQQSRDGDDIGDVVKSGSRSPSIKSKQKQLANAKANSVSSGGASTSSPVLGGVEMATRLPPLRREHYMHNMVSHIAPPSDSTFPDRKIDATTLFTIEDVIPRRPPSRRKSRMARIQSGLAKKKAVVHNVQHNGVPAAYVNDDVDIVSAKGIRNPAFEGDSVSAKRIGSNTSLKSFVPNGSLSNEISTVTYRKDEEVIEMKPTRT